MRLFKKILRVLGIFLIISALFAAAVALFVKYNWKYGVERLLSNSLGVGVRFTGANLDLKEYSLTVRGLKILSGKGFEKNTFYSETCAFKLDKSLYTEEKKFFITSITIDGGVLNLERNRSGVWNIKTAANTAGGNDPGAAYAAEPGEMLSLYTFVKNVKKVTIKNSSILLKDKYVPEGPFEMNFYNFNCMLDSEKDLETAYGCVPVKIALEFKIENSRYTDGGFSLEGKFAAYPDSTAMDMLITTSYIDIMQFLPYFESYTPFSFTSGIFSSTTKFSLANNEVNSLTNMVFHKLNILIDSGMENAQFLETSVNKLVPYLTSGGEIMFDFVVTGPLHNLKSGIGPQTKAAINAYFMTEASRALSQL